MLTLHIFFILSYCFIQICTSIHLPNLSELPSACPIYLTISPLSKNIDESKLEINWGPNCENPPEWIAVYHEDPTTSNTSPIAYIETKYENYGYLKTEINLGKIYLPSGWDHSDITSEIPKRIGPKCLPFYIVSYKEKKLITLDCLKIQPNWMSSLENIWDVPLKDIFIPGSHCSGCFLNRTSAKNPLLKKFGLAQNFDVWTQLVFGIRYLELSVGYYPSHNGNFWIMNENIRITPINSVLHDIRKFVILSGEVVILDINKFPLGLYKHIERHHELIEILNSELGDICFQSNIINKNNSYDLTINQMRKLEKTLLITYNDEVLTQEYDILWNSWKKHSSDYLKPNEINEFMKNMFSRSNKNNVGRVFFGIQGIESSYDPEKQLQSVRERADNVNRRITNLLAGPWSLNLNVIALDFFMASNIIDIAIYTNSYKIFNINGSNSNFELLK